MKNINRSFVTRVSALVLILALIASFSVCLADFGSSGAGVKGKSTIKVGANVTSSKLKKAFGSWSSRKSQDACVDCYASYVYKWSSKGVKVETIQHSKGGKEEVITIVVSKKGVKTIGGLKVGDSIEKIAKVYGTKCKVSGSTYRYESGKYTLSISTKKNKVTKITIIKG